MNYSNIKVRGYNKELFSIPAFDVVWSTMPDGLPHFEVVNHNGVKECIITARIKNGDDFFRLFMLCGVLTDLNIKYSIDLIYLSASRMDRPTKDLVCPPTLRYFAVLLKSIEVYSVLGAHSTSTIDLINPRYHLQCFDFYDESIKMFEEKYGPTSIVIPDLGSVKRFKDLEGLNSRNIVYCDKVRDVQTGKLSSFKILAGTPTENCLIIDDLCDGGGTFKGQSSILRENGAKNIGLSVIHGIFSKGTLKPEIDWVSCTDSFEDEYNPFVVDYVMKLLN